MREVAAPWSEIEEFSWAPADPADLAEVLGSLAGPARTATERNERLYCWISV